MTHTIEVLFFGPLQDWAGCRSMKLRLLPGTSIEACLTLLQKRIQKPPLKGFHVRVARNESFAGPDEILRDQDTLALMAPVSGG